MSNPRRCVYKASDFVKGYTEGFVGGIAGNVIGYGLGRMLFKGVRPPNPLLVGATSTLFGASMLGIFRMTMEYQKCIASNSPPKSESQGRPTNK